ncbi:MAG TPA: M55 family metallopeptidase [Woeseiaceae bacterium]|nr:M55 family metallopeptidase [Woeseiaceae bacterium]
MQFRRVIFLLMVAGSWNSLYAREEPVTAEQGPRTAAQTQARQSLKLYISADMEGVVGVASGDQLGPGGFEYERFREFMTAEVNACIEAAREAGVTEILVSDSHGNGQNLRIEKLPQVVMVVRSWPRPVELLAYLPNVERIDSHTMGFIGEDKTEISGFLEVALGYSVDLQP